MTAFYEALLFRVKDDPIGHLGRCDVRLLLPYRVGYDYARRDWGLRGVDYLIEREKFREWQESKVHLCSQNLQSFCRLITDTEEDAFELFFTLYETAFKENGIATPIAAFESERVDAVASSKTGSILSIITSSAFRTRPAMYFGNDNWIQSFWTMCNGYIRAEADLGIVDSDDAAKLMGFQTWIDERHPIGKGRNWGQLYAFLALDSEQGALDKMHEELEMFLAGKPADNPANWVTEVLTNVMKRHNRD